MSGKRSIFVLFFADNIYMKKIALFCLGIISLIYNASSQESVLQYRGSGSYKYIERSDLRRYDNGKYVGLTSREIRSFIMPVAHSGSPDRYYEGNFYVDEETRRNMNNVSDGINDYIPSSFRITPKGQLIMITDNGYPTFRSFPTFTTQKIKIGDRWHAEATRTVDPMNKGIFTKMPITVEYTYLKDEKYNGEDVYVFSAQWATRYGISYHDFGGDKELKSANGSHKATMYVSKSKGNALVVRDSVDETFMYTNGDKISFRGTISLFTEYPPAFDKTKFLPALQRIADIDDKEIEKITGKPVNTSSWVEGTGKPSAKNPAVSAGTSASSGNKTGTGKANSGSTKPAKTNQGKSPSSITSKTKDNKIKAEVTDAGIRLTIQNLKFKPDSAELLPGENDRLNMIAEVLKEAPDQMFLVEGHTAAVGFESGEMKLSVDRANAIVDALVKRGIARNKFITKGSGSTKPVADNSTPEGKAQNRRVEITILE